MQVFYQLGQISCQCLSPGGSMGEDMFCDFYLLKNHKIPNNLTTAKATNKISTDMESSEY
jgi:hypothetical protein